MIKFALIPALIIVLFNCNYKTIKPEKIIFHTSPCFGACPVYHLEITKNKKLRLYAEKVYAADALRGDNGDSTKMGYFTGVVSDSSYAKLVKQLQSLGLDTIRFDSTACCDAPVKTIIAYYNGKRRYLKSMFPPAAANPLIATLYEICETSKLKKAKGKFEIEEGDHVRKAVVKKKP